MTPPPEYTRREEKLAWAVLWAVIIAGSLWTAWLMVRALVVGRS